MRVRILLLALLFPSIVIAQSPTPTRTPTFTNTPTPYETPAPCVIKPDGSIAPAYLSSCNYVIGRALAATTSNEANFNGSIPSGAALPATCDPLGMNLFLMTSGGPGYRLAGCFSRNHWTFLDDVFHATPTPGVMQKVRKVLASDLSLSLPLQPAQKIRSGLISFGEIDFGYKDGVDPTNSGGVNVDGTDSDALEFKVPVGVLGLKGYVSSATNKHPQPMIRVDRHTVCTASAVPLSCCTGNQTGCETMTIPISQCRVLDGGAVTTQFLGAGWYRPALGGRVDFAVSLQGGSTIAAKGAAKMPHDMIFTALHGWRTRDHGNTFNGECTLFTGLNSSCSAGANNADRTCTLAASNLSVKIVGTTSGGEHDLKEACTTNANCGEGDTCSGNFCGSKVTDNSVVLVSKGDWAAMYSVDNGSDITNQPVHCQYMACAVGPF